MFWSSGRRRQRTAWIESEAEALVRELGNAGYDAARRKERGANDFSAARSWRAVKDAIARRTGQRQASIAVTPQDQTAQASPEPALASAAPPANDDVNFQELVAAIRSAPGGSKPIGTEASEPAATGDAPGPGRLDPDLDHRAERSVPDGASYRAAAWTDPALGSRASGFARFDASLAAAAAHTFLYHQSDRTDPMKAMDAMTSIDTPGPSMTQDEQARLLLEAVTDYAIYMLDPNGIVLSWNPGAERFKGYAASEIIGKPFSVFYTAEDIARGEPRRALDTATAEGRFASEGWRIRKDGRRFWASVAVDPIRAPDGALRGFAKITRDITAEVEAQRAVELAQAALFQSQKMEAIGQVTGGIATDFNNQLSVVRASLELVRKRLPKDHPSSGLIDNAVLGTVRAAALTKRMLSLSQRHELRSESIDLPSLVGEMIDLLQSCLGPSMTIDTEMAPTLNTILSDPRQIELALINLVLNAREAMPRGGAVTIAIREEHVPPGHRTNLAAGDYACLSVIDPGEGMDQTTLARAVEPFFTTRGTSKGSGLGLPMVHSIVTRSGGALALASVQGKGTTVELWFPIEQRQGKAASAPESSRGVGGRSGPLTVLAVDDDALVLVNLSAMIEDLGHKVQRAGSGRQALEILAREASVDLLITDQAMPGMTGAALVEMVMGMRPTLRTILASEPSERLPDMGDQVSLAKPFHQEDLARAIAEAFARDAPNQNVLTFPKRDIAP
ncbi:PAS domain S-box-containing protein [Roseiarcus fermentans]|uniref:histidine kinase n=1 Tax=Roseiarcus fermentans TaxID=1473586 RepID=A0A366ESU1_9HYPH|nr:PAS domain S-box protein [Roseiarcus fermentans]RBP04545.1 PAS domain S-box-containing protein [Roseiarcus fermentans]